MADGKKCLRCGGANLEPGRIQGGFDVPYFRPKSAKFLTLQTADVKITASMCLDCGTIDLVGDVAKVKSLANKAESA